MAKEWDLKVDPWYLEVSANEAMSDIYDALVEIVKNSDDSYHQMVSRGQRVADRGRIRIEINRRNAPEGRSTVVVKDKAEGMTFSAMREKIGKLGARTAGKGGHGFMGRGLKDCRALGIVRVESVVDGAYHACILEPASGGKIKFRQEADGARVPDAKRNEMGVQRNNNGTMVTLVLRQGVKVPQVATLARSLPMHYALRGITSSASAVAASASDIFVCGQKQKIAAPEIPGDTVADTTFSIDGYSDAKCRLQVWKSPVPLRYTDRRMRKSGILIRAGRSFHDCTLADYEQEELAKHYFGVLRCDYIQQLLDEYKKCFEDGCEHPPSNPSLLVMHNRHGLNPQHPFSRKLKAKIGEHIKNLVEKDRKGAEQEQGDISDRAMRDWLARMAKLAGGLLKDNEDDLTTREARALDGALKTGYYIVPPQFRVAPNQTKRLTVYVNRDICNSADGVSVVSRAKSIVEATAMSPLRPHWHDDRVMLGSFGVRGLALGEAIVNVRFGEEMETDVMGVVSRKDPGDDIEDDIEFEHPRYTVTEGGGKVVCLRAKNPLVPRAGVTAKIICPDEKYIAVKGGLRCRLERKQGTNYAEGTFKIEGRNITPNLILARLIAQLEYATAKAVVRVVEHKGVESGIRFELVKQSLGETRARWADLDGQPNLLRISAAHPSVREYVGEPPNFPGQNSPQSRALLTEIIAERVCLRLLQKRARDYPGNFSFENKLPRVVIDEIGWELQKEICNFAAKAHKIPITD